MRCAICSQTGITSASMTAVKPANRGKPFRQDRILKESKKALVFFGVMGHFRRRRRGRVVEGAPLLREYGSKAHRGFESLRLRQNFLILATHMLKTSALHSRIFQNLHGLSTRRLLKGHGLCVYTSKRVCEIKLCTEVTAFAIEFICQSFIWADFKAPDITDGLG